MPVYYRDEMDTFSTRKLRGAIRPRDLKQMTAVTLTSGDNVKTVKLARVPWRGLVPWRTRFVCPNCGNTATTLACIYGTWCCRKCVAWRNRGQRPSTIPKPPGRPPRIHAAAPFPSAAARVPRAPHTQPVDVVPPAKPPTSSGGKRSRS